MIDPKELRIGNLIYNESVVVAADGRTIFDLAYWEKPQYQPIPITPEWLERLGFEWQIFYQAWRVDGLDFNFDQWNDDYFRFSIFRTFNYIGEPIKYVHQLQNLYFALTGTELTIKQ